MPDAEYCGKSGYNKEKSSWRQQEELESVELYQAPNEGELHKVSGKLLGPLHLTLRLPLAIKIANTPAMTEVAK